MEYEGDSVAIEACVEVEFHASGGVVDFAAVPTLFFGVVFEACDDDDLVDWGVAKRLVGVLGVEFFAAVGVLVFACPVDLAFVGVAFFVDFDFALLATVIYEIVAYDFVGLRHDGDCAGKAQCHGQE